MYMSQTLHTFSQSESKKQNIKRIAEKWGVIGPFDHVIKQKKFLLFEIQLFESKANTECKMFLQSFNDF